MDVLSNFDVSLESEKPVSGCTSPKAISPSFGKGVLKSVNRIQRVKDKIVAREDRGYNKTDQKSNNLIILKRMLWSYHLVIRKSCIHRLGKKLPFTVY